jgi:hypothetical protein
MPIRQVTAAKRTDHVRFEMSDVASPYRARGTARAVTTRGTDMTTGTSSSSPTAAISTVSIPDGTDGDFLTLSEVAVILKVPVNTLRWWRQRGDGPASFKIGRHLVTTIGDLRSWIEDQKRGASADVA